MPHVPSTCLEPQELPPLVSRWMEVVRQCYKLGFEYHKVRETLHRSLEEVFYSLVVLYKQNTE